MTQIGATLLPFALITFVVFDLAPSCWSASGLQPMLQRGDVLRAPRIAGKTCNGSRSLRVSARVRIADLVAEKAAVPVLRELLRLCWHKWTDTGPLLRSIWTFFGHF